MLERHLQVLKMVIESEPIGIVKMSNETGYPHHKVTRNSTTSSTSWSR